jgi:hypothetical protein
MKAAKAAKKLELAWQPSWSALVAIRPRKRAQAAAFPETVSDLITAGGPQFFIEQAEREARASSSGP